MGALFTVLLACAEAEPAPAPELPPAEAPPPPEEPAPSGTIGGEPILPRPIVLGAISTDDVEKGMAAALPGIEACHRDSKRRGRVLVTFHIGADGTPTAAATASTSLREAATEECVNQRVMEARFVPLKSGKTAMVRYPFSF